MLRWEKSWAFAAALAGAVWAAGCAGTEAVTPEQDEPTPSVVTGGVEPAADEIVEEPVARAEPVPEPPAKRAPPTTVKRPKRAGPLEPVPPATRDPEISAGTTKAVEAALDWLAHVQSPDGSWPVLEGEDNYVPGVTGMALLAFLGAGETHQSGTHKDTVAAGLRYLKSIQDSEGCYGPRRSQHFMYNHGYATLAMSEAYGMSGSPLFKDSAQSGVNFILMARNPYMAWRYGVRDGDNDTTMTGLMVMALKSGKLAGLEVDDQAFRGALTWVDKMTDPEFGRVGYQVRGGQPARTMEAMDRFPADRSEAITAVGIVTRVFAGQDPKKNALIAKGADLLVAKPPVWAPNAGTHDYHYWYWGSVALYQVGGERWRSWKGALDGAVVPNQRKGDAEKLGGSWDPIDAWSNEGGRVYATATLCLALEISARYARATER